MPYKDPERGREARRAHYERNKERYRETQRRLRAQPGYRDGEYAKRAGERGTVQRRRKVPAAPRMTRTEAMRASRPRQISAEERALDEQRRAMKEATLRRLGLWPEAPVEDE